MYALLNEIIAFSNIWATEIWPAIYQSALLACIIFIITRYKKISAGKVLIHCAGGYRAAHMWAAYLIEYKKYVPETAVEYARVAGFGKLPIEGLLGKKAIFKFK